MATTPSARLKTIAKKLSALADDCALVLRLELYMQVRVLAFVCACIYVRIWMCMLCTDDSKKRASRA